MKEVFQGGILAFGALSCQSGMTTLPPLPMSRPKLTALAREKLPCSPRTTPRSQLIKEKDDIDHYLEVKFKGLSKEEVAAYRNTYKKNVCVDMLRDGYHKSFTELFALMEKWDALRDAARVRSVFWLQKPLEEQPDKLDHFYYYLTRAEVAERKKYFEDVYDNLYALACYFNNSEDKWVRNHFYQRCFEIAQLIKIDGGKKEAEAHGHLGLLFEEEGRLLEAAEHYEAFHQLTQGRIWKDEAGRFLNLLACESLLRTYRLLSDKMLENKDYTQAIRILIKASEIAKEGNDKKMEGEASYYLGLAHLAAGEHDTALAETNTQIEVKTEVHVELGSGGAFLGVGSCLGTQGQKWEPTTYFTYLVNILFNLHLSLIMLPAYVRVQEGYSEALIYNAETYFFCKAYKAFFEFLKHSINAKNQASYIIKRGGQLGVTKGSQIEEVDSYLLRCKTNWKTSVVFVFPESHSFGAPITKPYSRHLAYQQ
ncbi:hypothetical protein QTO34_015935 [Cnephaeus nilssonii]|uniref:Tetratricopeptide repeat protein 29 n=1 Tax=Cnephaeus nilssonii TaxID=3371016 RepID=A0AA40I610_CNENI|nr:hypothetical protein QTO34_015935 [Eptesicus nilssonii]